MLFMEDLAKRELLCGEIWVGSYFPSSRQLTFILNEWFENRERGQLCQQKSFLGGAGQVRK